MILGHLIGGFCGVATQKAIGKSVSPVLTCPVAVSSSSNNSI